MLKNSVFFRILILIVAIVLLATGCALLAKVEKVSGEMGTQDTSSIDTEGTFEGSGALQPPVNAEGSVDVVACLNDEVFGSYDPFYDGFFPPMAKKLDLPNTDLYHFGYELQLLKPNTLYRLTWEIDLDIHSDGSGVYLGYYYPGMDAPFVIEYDKSNYISEIEFRTNAEPEQWICFYVSAVSANIFSESGEGADISFYCDLTDNCTSFVLYEILNKEA